MVPFTGCLAGPYSEPLPEGTQEDEWPLAQPGINRFEGKTWRGGGWVAGRVDLPEGFVHAHGSGSLLFEFAYPEADDQSPHWLILFPAIELRPGAPPVAGEPATAYARLGELYYNYLDELPHQVRAAAGIDEVDFGIGPAQAVGFLLLTDVGLRVSVTLSFQGSSPDATTYEAVSGRNLTLDTEHRTQLPDAVSPVTHITATRPHPVSGLEGVAFTYESATPTMAGVDQSYTITHSDGRVVRNLRFPDDGGYLNSWDQSQHGEFVERTQEGQPFARNYYVADGVHVQDRVQFCAPVGTVSYEISSVNYSGWQKPVYFWLDGDPLANLGIQEGCPSAT